MPVTKVIMPRLEDGDQKAQDDIGHIMSLYDLHVMFVMFTSYLLRTTVVNKMIPYNNFKKCSPLTVHRCGSSLFQNIT